MTFERTLPQTSATSIDTSCITPQFPQLQQCGGLKAAISFHPSNAFKWTLCNRIFYQLASISHRLMPGPKSRNQKMSQGQEGYSFDLASDNVHSDLQILAEYTATYEWREAIRKIFNTATDRSAITIWDLAMNYRHNDRDILPEEGQDQGVHYVEVNAANGDSSLDTGESNLDTGESNLHQDCTTSSFGDASLFPVMISMPLFFPRRYITQSSINVVKAEEKFDLEVLFDRLNSADIRKDLEFMWRRNLFSDILVAIPYSGDPERGKGNVVAVFSSHRFMLRGRSSFFESVLIRAGVRGPRYPQTITTEDTVPIVFLPLTPIKPPIWELVFRFIYTGALEFRYSTQNFSDDLATAISIYKASTITRLQALKDLVSCVIIDMLHGLYQAAVVSPTTDEEILVVGCKCLQCAHHVPLILALSMDPQFKNLVFERGSRRALVGLFGPGWCTAEFSALPHFTQLLILQEFKKSITPKNVFSMILSANRAVFTVGFKVGSHSWLMSDALSRTEAVLSLNPAACFACTEWEILCSPISWKTTSQVTESTQKLRWIIMAFMRAVHPQNEESLRKTLKPFTDACQLFISMRELFHLWSQEIAELRRSLLLNMGHRDDSIADTAINETAQDTDLPAFTATTFSNTSSSTIESGSSPLLSRASSRTASTDYGLFYRRMYPSADFTDDGGWDVSSM